MKSPSNGDGFGSNASRQSRQVDTLASRRAPGEPDGLSRQQAARWPNGSSRDDREDVLLRALHGDFADADAEDLILAWLFLQPDSPGTVPAARRLLAALRRDISPILATPRNRRLLVLLETIAGAQTTPNARGRIRHHQHYGEPHDDTSN
ncbi:hypothetical protein IC757_15905 [Wenzhouxiangella sp. AB-CW3]|uniref:hypothetical protein n=1 Tax=Wenzhouxiangella sp. AB-CW3 TaxID=2771012 RepID=UPI00168C0B5F|nr:hypothetical protein [Wenzhouxiangella sp. AB-CW3]QOC22467.1 hypothetical protein IC757_15905 [Wenzhouxiangella sp. AB-CW3]